MCRGFLLRRRAEAFSARPLRRDVGESEREDEREARVSRCNSLPPARARTSALVSRSKSCTSRVTAPTTSWRNAASAEAKSAPAGPSAMVKVAWAPLGPGIEAAGAARSGVETLVDSSSAAISCWRAAVAAARTSLRGGAERARRIRRGGRAAESVMGVRASRPRRSGASREGRQDRALRGTSVAERGARRGAWTAMSVGVPASRAAW